MTMTICLGRSLAMWFNLCFARTSCRFFAAVVAAGVMGSLASAADPIRIMPLGDSITAGTTDSQWNVPFSFGYRGHLYELLTDAGYDFQFVGGSPEPWNGAPYGVPPAIVGPDLRTVGQDAHRGYGGSVISDILNGNGYDPGVVAALNADHPDIVLLMIGINDIARYGNGGDPVDAKNSIHALVDTILTTAPDVKLIVAQIHPYVDGSLTDSVSNYNSYITDTLVPAYSDQGYHISTVDQYSNFVLSDGSSDASLYSYIIHPNVAGYEKVASTWFEGIQAATHAPEPSSGGIAAMMGLGLAMIAVVRNRRSRKPRR